MSNKENRPALYHPEFERDNCGFGLISHMDGNPSHWLVSTAIEALNRMTHRGAIAADGKGGDGCGLLMTKPAGFLTTVAAEKGIKLTDGFGVGVVFLDRDEDAAQVSRAIVEKMFEPRSNTSLPNTLGASSRITETTGFWSSSPSIFALATCIPFGSTRPRSDACLSAQTEFLQIHTVSLDGWKSKPLDSPESTSYV